LDIALFIAERIALNRNRSFSRFIIRLAVTATTVSVAAMVLSLAFINGFQKAVGEKVFSFWGHLRIQHFEPFKVGIAEETPIPRNDSVERQLGSHPEVSAVKPYATKSAILNANGTIEGVLLKGVASDYRFDQLGRFLKKGHWMGFGDSLYSREIVVSTHTAERLGVGVGDDILIYFIQSGQDKPRTRKLKVSGVFKTGIEHYDQAFAFGDIRLIQRLNDWSADQIGGYEVVLTDYRRMDTLSTAIFENLPAGWDSQTMREIQPDIFDWLNLQNTNKYILIAVMTLVAVINLITCLIILVLERTRMVGLLKAVGMNDWQVQRIFLGHGALITLAGVGSGLLLGLGIAWLQLKTGFIRLNEESYYIDRAPVEIVGWQVAAVAAGTFAVCFLVLMIPTIVSRRIQPSRAVQFR
jgi:lipoprotein-releasing system permease protein